MARAKKVLWDFPLLLLVPSFLAFLGISLASYCGQSAIPFSLEVRPDGQPVLGCARPACFGWTAEGQRAADAAQFYRIWGRPDGFVRMADLEKEQQPKGNDEEAPRKNNNSQMEYSICERHYARDRCPAGTWVGGIGPAATIDSQNPLKMLCCSYQKLAQSVASGQAQIRPGQILQGGQVVEQHGGHEIAFEYIANLQRLFDREGVVYVVEMRKFDCFSSKSADENVADQISSNGNAKEGTAVEETNLEDSSAEDLRIPFGPQEKDPINEDEEQKILKEFSEYEEDRDTDQLLQMGRKNAIVLKKESTQITSTKSPHPAAVPQVKRQRHLHIGHSGGGGGGFASSLRAENGKSLSEYGKNQNVVAKTAFVEQPAHKFMAREIEENGEAGTGQQKQLQQQEQQQHPPQKQYNPVAATAAPSVLPVVASIQQQQQQPQLRPQPKGQSQNVVYPQLMSRSPFGGYQMHQNPPVYANKYPLLKPLLIQPESGQPNAASFNGQNVPILPAPSFQNVVPNIVPSDGQNMAAPNFWSHQQQPLPIPINSNGPRRHSLIKIPSPEEIENALPHGRLLLSNLARTFLGLQRLF